MPPLLAHRLGDRRTESLRVATASTMPALGSRPGVAIHLATSRENGRPGSRGDLHTGKRRNRTLFVTEKKKASAFMVDSCADVRAIPATPADRHTHHAINYFSIHTFGQKLISLGLVLRRVSTGRHSPSHTWSTFSPEFHLHLEVRGHRIVDDTTHR